MKRSGGQYLFLTGAATAFIVGAFGFAIPFLSGWATPFQAATIGLTLLAATTFVVAQMAAEDEVRAVLTEELASAETITERVNAARKSNFLKASETFVRLVLSELVAEGNAEEKSNESYVSEDDPIVYSYRRAA